mmetsp:Transcript_3009/g.454  ORF Transcript_3009/g.454 Transcript_3009/m.454 type:complete len:114 (+) Transcript_3009:583-924(+)
MKVLKALAKFFTTFFLSPRLSSKSLLLLFFLPEPLGRLLPLFTLKEETLDSSDSSYYENICDTFRADYRTGLFSISGCECSAVVSTSTWLNNKAVSSSFLAITKEFLKVMSSY